MTGGSLGLRSSSYGSLQQPFSNIVLPIQTTITPPRKPFKMFKEKEKLFHWFFKFAGRKKVGMMFLCIASAAVFVWVLYVGKGEDSQEGLQNYRFNRSTTLDSSPIYIQPVSEKENIASSINVSVDKVFNASPPPLFLGYKLPPGHLCETFTLPPPPADKKRTGPRPCPVCYLLVEEAVSLMPKYLSPSPIINNLTYAHEENLTKSEFGGSDFGGYPSLQQRADSYDVRESMTVHCGFVKGIKPGLGTGFDIEESDLYEMEQCRGVVVASAIFGNFDTLRQPTNVSDIAKKTVCFFMFVDEETEAFLKTSAGLDSSKRIGLWRITLVKNLPYTDPRRNGKVPKLLLHRLFPNARYSLWIDGKLELVVDPYQVLERFLWRKNTTIAISRHYKRFDVFVEAEANKAAGKYDNSSIDFQIVFYNKEGLTPYTSAKLPLTSDVPEGCVIIKEHNPISNLFTCLWFNEVDRFTSRDQLSFSTVRDKIRSKVNWTVSMFLDCERRNFVVQGYHRDVLERMSPPLHIVVHPPPPPPLLPPPPATDATSLKSPQVNVQAPVKKLPVRRGRERKPSSRRHPKGIAGTGTTKEAATTTVMATTQTL
uniref:TOD1/MUCI70 glycosyltransferase-like domain-containing protein n=1 Tax=Kalanchoe fedtschenkoi TaxID=63787 RepID=A0A7N0RF34_KALFE